MKSINSTIGKKAEIPDFAIDWSDLIRILKEIETNPEDFDPDSTLVISTGEYSEDLGLKESAEQLTEIYREENCKKNTPKLLTKITDKVEIANRFLRYISGKEDLTIK